MEVSPICFPFTLHRQIVILDLCLRKTRSEKLRNGRDAIIFEKLRVQFFFLSTRKPSFKFSSAFEKLCSPVKLVRTVILTVKIKLRFQISPAK